MDNWKERSLIRQRAVRDYRDGKISLSEYIDTIQQTTPDIRVISEGLAKQRIEHEIKRKGKLGRLRWWLGLP